MPSQLRRADGFRGNVRSAAVVAVLIALGVASAAQAQTPLQAEERPARAETSGASDGRFQAVLGAFITAAGTDVAVSMYQIGRGHAREAGFGSWWQDSPVAFAATKSALTAVFAYQLQRLHRTRPKTAFVLGIVSTSVETALIVRSARIKPRGR